MGSGPATGRLISFPSHTWPMVTSIGCVATDPGADLCRFRWSVSPWIYSGGGRMFTRDDESVHDRDELGKLVSEGEGPSRGDLGRLPGRGGSSADGRVPWKWGVQLELVPVMIWQSPLQIESGFFHESGREDCGQVHP